MGACRGSEGRRKPRRVVGCSVCHGLTLPSVRNTIMRACMNEARVECSMDGMYSFVKGLVDTNDSNLVDTSQAAIGAVPQRAAVRFHTRIRKNHLSFCFVLRLAMITRRHSCLSQCALSGLRIFPTIIVYIVSSTTYLSTHYPHHARHGSSTENRGHCLCAEHDEKAHGAVQPRNRLEHIFDIALP